jgi:hypothetical protein
MKLYRADEIEKIKVAQTFSRMFYEYMLNLHREHPFNPKNNETYTFRDTIYAFGDVLGMRVSERVSEFLVASYEEEFECSAGVARPKKPKYVVTEEVVPKKVMAAKTKEAV